MFLDIWIFILIFQQGAEGGENHSHPYLPLPTPIYNYSPNLYLPLPIPTPTHPHPYLPLPSPPLPTTIHPTYAYPWTISSRPMSTGPLDLFFHSYLYKIDHIHSPKTVRHNTQNFHHKPHISWRTNHFNLMSLEQSNVEKPKNFNIKLPSMAINNKY